MQSSSDENLNTLPDKIAEDESQLPEQTNNNGEIRIIPLSSHSEQKNIIDYDSMTKSLEDFRLKNLISESIKRGDIFKKGQVITCICPRCAAAFLPTVYSHIRWDQQEQKFSVSLVLNVGENTGDIGLIMTNLPSQIGINSHCTCGSHLSFEDYTIKRNTEGIEFAGIYSCPSCKKKQASLIARIAKAFGTGWKETKKVEIAGVFSYEKEANID